MIPKIIRTNENFPLSATCGDLVWYWELSSESRLTNGDHVLSEDQTVEVRFRNICHYLSKHHSETSENVGGFATFNSAIVGSDSSMHITYYAVAMPKDKCRRETPSKKDAFGGISRSDVPGMFRQAHNYAKNRVIEGKKIEGAYPDFQEQSGHYGVILIPEDVGFYTTVKNSALGNPHGIEQIFQKVDDYALSLDKVDGVPIIGGFPTFHQQENGELVYGIVLIRGLSGAHRIPIGGPTLGYPNTQAVCYCWKLSGYYAAVGKNSDGSSYTQISSYSKSGKKYLIGENREKEVEASIENLYNEIAWEPGSPTVKATKC